MVFSLVDKILREWPTCGNKMVTARIEYQSRPFNTLLMP